MDAPFPPLPDDRLAIGQLLVRLLFQFRAEIYSIGEADTLTDFDGIRMTHLTIWASVGTNGIRLTELADRASLSLPACSELVSELEATGYLTRRSDPTDRRAKLIFPTKRGADVLRSTSRWVAQLEHNWRQRTPDGAFDRACTTFDQLLTSLIDERPS